MEDIKDTIIIYHAQCSDGFGAAYAAWKKFGDNASYIPMKTQVEVDDSLTNKTIYVVDYSLPKAIQEKLQEQGCTVTVIDHHKTAEADVTAFPQNIFDQSHSGAVLTWQYFHHDAPVPELLLQVEDHDLWKFEVADNMPFNAALRQYPFEFAVWDELITKLKDTDFREAFVAQGTTIVEFEEKLINGLLEYKERVRFEGNEVWALNVSRTYRSILGHKLAELNKDTDQPELGIIYYRNQGAVHISLRSNGEIDVSEIAEKYGGGGHKNAASIRVDSFTDLPFEFIAQ